MTAPVDDMRPCPWCRTTQPAGHDCVGGRTACPTDAGEPCGTCVTCLSEEMGHYDNPEEEIPDE